MVQDIKDQFLWAHRQGDVVWMSQNTNSISLPDYISNAIIEAVKRKLYNQYPYAQGYPGLPEAILEDLGLLDTEPKYSVLLTNGGIEALYILNRALLREGDEVISTDPTFMPIHHQIVMDGAKPIEIPIYDANWKLTPEEINERITPKTKMILLIDPHNPLGSGYSPREVKAICEIAQDNNLYLVDDITYRDFAYSHTLTSEFYPEKTLIVYSFSKNCGFAGMRIGALITPENIMKKTLKPYDTNVLSVNVLAQVAALKALETKDQWLKSMVAQSRKNQEIIKKCVDKIDGVYIPVFPSSTNMLVIDISALNIDPDDIQREMLFGYKVFIRSGKYVSPRFGHRFVRVSFTVPEDGVRRFASAFPEVLEKLYN